MAFLDGEISAERAQSLSTHLQQFRYIRALSAFAQELRALSKRHSQRRRGWPNRRYARKRRPKIRLPVHLSENVGGARKWARGLHDQCRSTRAWQRWLAAFFYQSNRRNSR